MVAGRSTRSHQPETQGEPKTIFDGVQYNGILLSSESPTRRRLVPE